MVRVDGDLDPETGQTLLTALDAVETAEVHGGGGPDLRSPAQRRADALGSIARRFLDDAGRNEVGGERPHVTVLVDLQALGGDPAGHAELEQAGPISAEAARAAARIGGARRALPVPGLRPPPQLVRRTSRGALGRRR